MTTRCRTKTESVFNRVMVLLYNLTHWHVWFALSSTGSTALSIMVSTGPKGGVAYTRGGSIAPEFLIKQCKCQDLSSKRLWKRAGLKVPTGYKIEDHNLMLEFKWDFNLRICLNNHYYHWHLVRQWEEHEDPWQWEEQEDPWQWQEHEVLWQWEEHEDPWQWQEQISLFQLKDLRVIPTLPKYLDEFMWYNVLHKVYLSQCHADVLKYTEHNVKIRISQKSHNFKVIWLLLNLSTGGHGHVICINVFNLTRTKKDINKPISYTKRRHLGDVYGALCYLQPPLSSPNHYGPGGRMCRWL